LLLLLLLRLVYSACGPLKLATRETKQCSKTKGTHAGGRASQSVVGARTPASTLFGFGRSDPLMLLLLPALLFLGCLICSAKKRKEKAYE